MSDLADRLAELSPERRRLLERLAGPSPSVHQPSAPTDETRLDPERFDFDGAILQEPREVRRFYESVSRQLDAGPFADHALFLNYGYVPNDNPRLAQVRPPPGQVNRNGLRLVLELIGDTEVGPEQDVLDVGCGRGGTVHTLRTHFAPRRALGIDLAGAAVAFCRRTQGAPDAWFLQASAQQLPFRAEAFDVVTNVESSHCYPDIDAFLAEVHRVLRPGGAFLYTDLVASAAVEELEGRLAGLGFGVERTQDITSNVLLSCDETAAIHARAFHDDNDPSLVDSFLGVPSSALYEAMKNGSQRYMLYRWRKRHPHDPGVTP